MAAQIAYISEFLRNEVRNYVPHTGLTVSGETRFRTAGMFPKFSRNLGRDSFLYGIEAIYSFGRLPLVILYIPIGRLNALHIM